MISQWGVSGEKNPFAATKAAPMKALTVSSLRKPVRSRMRFAMVFMNSAPTAAMKVSEPEARGLRPKPTCSISGRRNGNGADADAEEEAAHDADAEGGDLQKAELQHGKRGAPRVEDIENEADRADDHAAGGDLCRDQMPPARGEAEHEQGEAEAGEKEADGVEGRRIVFLDVRHEAHRHHDSENADGNVDEEDPAPVEIGGDEAAERRADDGADEGRDRQGRERLHDLAARDAAQQHEPPHRHHHGSADALERSGRSRTIRGKWRPRRRASPP